MPSSCFYDATPKTQDRRRVQCAGSKSTTRTSGRGANASTMSGRTSDGVHQGVHIGLEEISYSALDRHGVFHKLDGFGTADGCGPSEAIRMEIRSVPLLV